MDYALMWIIILAVYMIGSMFLTWSLRLKVMTQEDTHDAQLKYPLVTNRIGATK